MLKEKRPAANPLKNLPDVKDKTEFAVAHCKQPMVKTDIQTINDDFLPKMSLSFPKGCTMEVEKRYAVAIQEMYGMALRSDAISVINVLKMVESKDARNTSRYIGMRIAIVWLYGRR